MSLNVTDRWLFLGLGVFALVAVHGVGYALKDILRLTEIHEQPRQKHVCAVSQDTEDAIQFQSLHLLTKSHNLDIRNAAIKIVCDRFLSNPSRVTELTQDLYSADEHRRLAASNVLKLLERFASPDAFVAVSFLESLRDNANQAPSSWLAEIEQWDQLRTGPLSRLREESFEEQALRRRRREAVVVNEGDHPVTQQDIIQRNPSLHNTIRQLEDRRVERALEAISGTGVDELVDEQRMVYISEGGVPAEVVHTTNGAPQPGPWRRYLTFLREYIAIRFHYSYYDQAHRLIEAYQSTKEKIRNRRRLTVEALGAIEPSDGARVYVMPGGLPPEIFRTFDPNTIKRVVVVTPDVEIDENGIEVPSMTYSYFSPYQWNELQRRRVMSDALLKRRQAYHDDLIWNVEQGIIVEA
ncbi:hypothetical protein EG328_000681 [Venturia inaequalis]|uniref:Uncharacterized protein n=1 Tax=Venturia inaequalis TaxID=5025 RepID=A0A8H3VSH0_VENIN|nr:hypothetical protein EG328_000681 [Venturia inaequalis]KAE9993691.1 hypothetical protein EG327_003700 [Venturia inaequalis]